MPRKDSTYSAVPTEQLISAVHLIVTHLKSTGEFSDDEIAKLISTSNEQKISIPLELFANESLSSLEIVCKYLKENLHYSYRKIGSLVNRNERTIWTTYRNASAKLPSLFAVEKPHLNFPVSILCNRSYSVLESIILFLDKSKSISETARLLHKPYSTVWLTLKRAKRKSNA